MSRLAATIFRARMGRLLVLAAALSLAACHAGRHSKDEYVVAVTVFGLTTPGLVLQNNGGNDLSIPGIGSFRFATPVRPGGVFNVTVANQPAGLICTVMNGTGSNVRAVVADVRASCNVVTHHRRFDRRSHREWPRSAEQWCG
jgi:hypothetical protein